jgi:hypothetical protein
MKHGCTLFLLFFLSCTTSQKFPGSELIGTFIFTASLSSNDCQFSEVPDGGFTFSGTFSYNPGGAAYFTVGRTNRDAGFDGQYVVSEAVAPREFIACQCGNGTLVDETLRVALLSQSQKDASDGGCPPNPLDGGVPLPDGGIQPPQRRGSKFDAVLACGELVDVVIPSAPTCQCPSCTMISTVVGVPQ